MSNVWKTLSAIDCSKYVEKKNGFTYLSWAWAWTILKTNFPTAQYVKHMFDVNGTKLPYMIDGEGNAYVTVTVTILPDGPAQPNVPVESATEIMPVLNHANRPIKNPNSFEVNASLQRCMVKAIAALGLGCYIYAGEDMPMPAPVATGGGDSSSHNPVTGNTGTPKQLANETVAGVPVVTPEKIASPMSLADQVSKAPDLQSLKDLYERVTKSRKLSADEVKMFSDRKGEF